MATRTAARRPPARKPARKKRRGKAPYREIIFIPAVAAGPACWAWLGEPWQARGLLVLAAVSLLLVPVFMLAVITTPLALAKAAVPRPLRHWYRRGGHWWRHYAIPHPRPKPLLVRMVWAADRGRCVGCGIRQRELAAQQAQLQLMALTVGGAGQVRKLRLQIDHFFPFILGGLLIIWNTFLLCPRCNMVKSDFWKDSKGKVTYRSFGGYGDQRGAAAIARRERLHRFNLLRWWRAAWAL